MRPSPESDVGRGSPILRLVVLVLMVGFIGAFRPNFLTPSSIANLAQQVPL